MQPADQQSRATASAGQRHIPCPAQPSFRHRTLQDYQARDACRLRGRPGYSRAGHRRRPTGLSRRPVPLERSRSSPWSRRKPDPAERTQRPKQYVPRQVRNSAGDNSARAPKLARTEFTSPRCVGSHAAGRLAAGAVELQIRSPYLISARRAPRPSERSDRPSNFAPRHRTIKLSSAMPSWGKSS